MKLFDENGKEVFLVTVQIYDEFTVFVSQRDILKSEIEALDAEFNILSSENYRKYMEIGKKHGIEDRSQEGRDAWIDKIPAWKKEIDENCKLEHYTEWMRKRLDCKIIDRIISV